MDTIISELHRFFDKMSTYETKGWIGVAFTTIFTGYAVSWEGLTVHSVLAGIGSLLAGIGTAYYYIQKATLIKTEIAYIRKLIEEIKHQ